MVFFLLSLSMSCDSTFPIRQTYCFAVFCGLKTGLMLKNESKSKDHGWVVIMTRKLGGSQKSRCKSACNPYDHLDHKNQSVQADGLVYQTSNLSQKASPSCHMEMSRKVQLLIKPTCFLFFKDKGIGLTGKELFCVYGNKEKVEDASLSMRSWCKSGYMSSGCLGMGV